jgi:hypothetical protein
VSMGGLLMVERLLRAFAVRLAVVDCEGSQNA